MDRGQAWDEVTQCVSNLSMASRVWSQPLGWGIWDLPSPYMTIRTGGPDGDTPQEKGPALPPAPKAWDLFLLLQSGAGGVEGQLGPLDQSQDSGWDLSSHCNAGEIPSNLSRVEVLGISPVCAG